MGMFDSFVEGRKLQKLARRNFEKKQMARGVSEEKLKQWEKGEKKDRIKNKLSKVKDSVKVGWKKDKGKYSKLGGSLMKQMF